MSNNQPKSRPNQGAPKTNPTRTYSQTKRPTRRLSKAEIARRIFIAKCIIVFCMIFVLGGGVFLLSRSGLFKKSSKTERTMLSSLTSQSTESTTPPETSDTTPATTEAQGSLAGYTVILDPGHGGNGEGEKTDRGCDYPYYSGQNEEPGFTLKIAELLTKELESRGAKVYVTHTDDEYYSLFYRCAYAHNVCLDIAKERGILSLSAEREQELRASLQKVMDINSRNFSNGGMGLMGGSGVGKDLNDLFEIEYQLTDVVFISLHINSLYDEVSANKYEPVTKQRGAQVYYITDDSINAYEQRKIKNPGNSEFGDPNFPIREEYHGRYNDNNKLLAQTIYDTIVANNPDLRLRYDDPVKTDAFAVLREHGLVGCLVEFAFVTNDEDRAILQDETALGAECSSVADAIEDYFKKINTTSSNAS